MKETENHKTEEKRVNVDGERRTRTKGKRRGRRKKMKVVMMITEK